ncbi:MAG: hypothetical protein H6544_00795 [Prevotellaceae bacterium]|nr:hypothetical protein [Prevotellaceae bacterium]
MMDSSMRIFIPLALALLLSSCTPRLFRDMESVGKVGIAKEDLCPVFAKTDTVITFNMQIDYKENNFAGLLVVSGGERERSTRLVLTSYFGMTVFDFEIDADSFVVNRCFEQMNRKVVLSLLEKDFRTLLFYNVPESIKARKCEKGSMVGYKMEASDGKAYYLIDGLSRQLQKIHRPGAVRSLQIDFVQYEQGFPSVIEMKHPTIGLKMRLELVK